MTDEEKAIVMAHTGICMLTEDKFHIFHEYVEKLMGRPVYTHELGFLADEIKEKSKNDFIKLCKEEEEHQSLESQRFKPIILQEHDAEPRRLRAILDTATEEIYVCRLTKEGTDILGITIEERGEE